MWVYYYVQPNTSDLIDINISEDYSLKLLNLIKMSAISVY